MPKKLKRTRNSPSPAPASSVTLDELRGELLVIEYRLAKHIRALRAEADAFESTVKYIASLDKRLFPPNHCLGGKDSA